MLALVTPAGKVPGTGLLQVTKILHSLSSGGSSSSMKALLATAVGDLPGLFGDYPFHRDIAPSAIFVALFSIFAIAHLYIFFRNMKCGQSFWPSFGLAWYCIFRVIGFGLRINWAKDVMRVKVGIAATVFCVVPVVYVSIMNMLFGHRIFTWRHPETGNAVWFAVIMNVTYVVVLGVIVMGILGQAIPYIYFLDQHHLNMCRRVARAAAILQTLYSFAGICLIVNAYTFKPGRIDGRFGKFYKHGEKVDLPATISPTWIESTNPMYFPEKGSQHVIIKDTPEANAIRVISNRRPPAGGLSNHHGHHHERAPKMTTNVILILSVSVLLSISAAFRTASTFKTNPRGGVNGNPLGHWLYHNWLMYLLFGVFEVIVNVLYLAMRADLRFYIPDMARKRKSTDPAYVPSDSTGVLGGPDNLSKPEVDHINNVSYSSSDAGVPAATATATANPRNSDMERYGNANVPHGAVVMPLDEKRPF